MIPFVDLKSPVRLDQERSRRGDPGRIWRAASSRSGARWRPSRQEFAAYCQAKHGIGVNTGTSALHLALLAANVGPGDEVITVPFTFVATVSAICYAGATPVFVDIDPRTFKMDPKAIEAAITDKDESDHSGAPVRPDRPTWTRSSRSPGVTAWS